MTSYPKHCNTCGQRIIITTNPAGAWVALEPNGTGIHQHWSGVDGRQGQGALEVPVREWSAGDRRHPLTFWTICWWCREAVYFHTNGFGDCVLFDELGWPWQVHSCWEDHKAKKQQEQRERQFIADMDAKLDAAGFDGRSIRPVQKRAKPSEDFGAVKIDGYIADHGALQERPTGIFLKATRTEVASSELVQIDIVGGDHRLYPFLLPMADAKRLNNYDVARLTGVWRTHHGKFKLIATSYSSRRFPDKGTVTWSCRAHFESLLLLRNVVA